MPGAGITYWGPAGDVSGPPTGISLWTFDFEVKAKSIGSAIKITFTTPSSTEAPEWNRRIRILRKQGEWPVSWDDADAVVSVDDVFPGPAEADHEYTESNLVPHTIGGVVLTTCTIRFLVVGDRLTLESDTTSRTSLRYLALF